MQSQRKRRAPDLLANPVLDVVSAARLRQSMKSLQQMQSPMSVYLRVALAASFLSAVSDRYGVWGPFGTPNVSWGEFGRFVGYVGTLNWFVPAGLWPPLAVLSTAAELVLGLLLLLGLWTRTAAILSVLLLAIFALEMAVGVGPEAPLSASVWTASAGAGLLATLPETGHVWRLDHWLRRPRRRSQQQERRQTAT
jgi:uncharacterized membrane protein YphA (DoxX/SURF4 family)